MSSDVAELIRDADALPDGWRSLRLEEVTRLGGGTTPSRGEAGYWDGATIPWATPSDITSLAAGATTISGTENMVTERALAECSLPLNPPGTVLMTSRATIGFVAINAVPMTTNQGFITFNAGRDLDPEFLLHWLIAQRSNLVAAAGGSTFKELSRGTAKLLPILLPPLDEQRRIAEVLRSVDGAIAAADLALSQAVKVERDVMIAQLLLPRTASDPLPDGWQATAIGAIGKVQAGRQRAPSFTQGFVRPYLRVANVFDGYIDTSDVLEMPFTDREFAQYRLLPGDILLNEGQSIELVGRAARYEGNPADCCFQNTLVRFRATAVNANYAYALIRTMYAAGRFSEIASRTTSVAHLGVSRFAALLAPVPPAATQIAIAELFAGLERTVAEQRLSLASLRTKKEGLVANLLSGRVRVPA